MTDPPTSSVVRAPDVDKTAVRDLTDQARFARKKGDRKASLAAFQAAAALDPSNIGVAVEIAQDLRDLGRLAESETTYQRIVRQAPGHFSALIGLGRLLRQRGDRARSLAAFEAAAIADPGNINVKLDAALELRELGRLDEAEKLLRRVLGDAPKHVGALSGLGQLLRQRGDRAGALAAFEAAIEVDPNNVAPKIDFAQYLRDLGRLDDAEAIYRQALQIAPNHVATLIGLGRLLRQRGDRAGSLAAFEAAAIADPGNINVKLDAALELRELGRLDEAEKLLRRVLGDAPKHVGALSGLGQLLRQRGDRAGALAAFEAAIEVDPNNVAPKIDFAQYLRDLGRLDDAEAIYRQALQIAPNHVATLIGLGRLLRQRGDRAGSLAAFEAAAIADPGNINVKLDAALELRELGRLDEAEKLLRRVLGDAPKHVGALSGLGQLLRQRGDRAGALAAFEAAIEVDPNNVAPKIDFAQYLRDLGRLDDAEAIYRQALQIAPNHVATLIGLGRLLRQRGDRAGSLAAFEAAAIADPGNINVKLDAALELRELGRLDEAEKLLRRVLGDAPKHVGALSGLGQLLRQRGDRAGALAAFEAAIEVDPNNVAPKIDFAQYLRDLGRLDDAEAIYRQALQIAPNHVATLIGLGRLLRQRGDRAGSLAAFEAAAIADPGNISAALEIAVEFRDRGQFTEAERLINSLIDQDPTVLRPWMHKGELLRLAGDREGALNAFQTILKHHPDDIQLQIEIAIEQRALGRPTESLQTLKKAIDREPNNLNALMQLGEHAWLAEDIEESYQIFRRAISAHPGSMRPYLRALTAATEMGGVENFAELLVDARARFGPSPELAAREVDQLRRIRRWNDAKKVIGENAVEVGRNFSLWAQSMHVALTLGDREAATEALKNAPANSNIDLSRVELFRGQLAEMNWQFDDAIACYHEALKLNPRDGWIHDSLAKCCLLTFDIQTAQKHLKASLEANTSRFILRGRSLNISQSHNGQLLDEFSFDRELLEELRELRRRPASDRVQPLMQLVKENPDHTASAITLLIALRETGQFDDAARIQAPHSYGRIPKRIIQYWDAAPPEEVSQMMDDWRVSHPQFQYLLFDDQSAQKFLTAQYDKSVLLAYKRGRHPAQRADVFRLAYLAKNGGFYIDADDKRLINIDTFVPQETAFFNYQESYGTIGNNFMGVSPGHPVILHALRLAVEAMNRGDSDLVWLSTGPGLMTRAFAQVIAGCLPKIRDWQAGTTILELGQFQRLVAYHFPLRYKTTDKHWGRDAYKRAKRVTPEK